MIAGQWIADVYEFTYLGATVCKERGGMKDLKNRLSKARSAFVRLNRIWRSKIILRRTIKLRLYNTLVVPVLPYGCETWIMNKRDDRAVEVFYNKCLRGILQMQGPCKRELSWTMSVLKSCLKEQTWNQWVKRWSSVDRGVLNKCLDGEAPPRGPTPYPFIYHFSQKRYPFHIPSIDKWCPFHIPCLQLYISFNCCKCIVI